MGLLTLELIIMFKTLIVNEINYVLVGNIYIIYAP